MLQGLSGCVTTVRVVLCSDQTQTMKVSVLLSRQVCNQYALSLLVVCSVLSVQLHWRKTQNQVVLSCGGGAVLLPPPSSSVTQVWLFPTDSFQLLVCLLLRGWKTHFPT